VIVCGVINDNGGERIAICLSRQHIDRFGHEIFFAPRDRVFARQEAAQAKAVLLMEEAVAEAKTAKEAPGLSEIHPLNTPASSDETGVREE